MGLFYIRMFIDQVEIKVKAGRGGDGCVAFLREKFRPKGGPCGGDGGRGGSVYAEVAPGLRTLLDFRSRRVIKADNGNPGEGKNKTGRSADDVTIKIPPGTIIRDAGSGETIADMNKPGQRALLAKGGDPGRGNARFATPTLRTPTRFEPGRAGEERKLLLDLRVLADAGTIGPPNSGKSTLIGAVSTAKPRVGDYPFTTLAPSVGLVRVGDFGTFTFADIPGLIEFAHQGKGLGHEFLRHLGRTQVLVQLVPMQGKEPDEEILDAVNNFRMIQNELEAYGHGLYDKPRLVVISKSDLALDESVLHRVADSIRESGELESPPLAISSHQRRGLDELLRMIMERLEDEQELWPESHIADILFDDRET